MDARTRAEIVDAIWEGKRGKLASNFSSRVERGAAPEIAIHTADVCNFCFGTNKFFPRK